MIYTAITVLYPDGRDEYYGGSTLEELGRTWVGQRAPLQLERGIGQMAEYDVCYILRRIYVYIIRQFMSLHGTTGDPSH